MAIVAIRLPSGWEADQDSIQKLTATVGLKRFEVVENKISLYFDEVNLKRKNCKKISYYLFVFVLS